MTHAKRQLHLGAFFFGAGHHLAAWRHPDVDPSAYTQLNTLKEWARVAEAAKFDAIFFADNVGMSDAPAENLARNALPTCLTHCWCNQRWLLSRSASAWSQRCLPPTCRRTTWHANSPRWTI